MTDDEPERTLAWLIAVWPRIGLVCAGFLLVTLAALWTTATAPLVMAAVLLPMYMVHQYEEHGHGRFVADFNETIGGGLPLLTPRSAFWINILAVELAFPIAVLLARVVAPGLALIPVWLTLVNATVHIASALRTRRSNPGLVTAMLLFLPVGGFAAFFISGRTAAPLAANGLALLVALVVHGGIAVYAVWRKAVMNRQGARLEAATANDGTTPAA